MLPAMALTLPLWDITGYITFEKAAPKSSAVVALVGAEFAKPPLNANPQFLYW